MQRRWLGKDFHKKTLQNPFGRIEHYQTKSSKRGRISRILFILALGGWIYFLYFSSTFNIDDLTINGLEKINKSDIKQLFDDELNGRRFLIFPKKNILVFSIKSFSKKINQKYFIEDIEIKKAYPKKINITITEKKSTALVLINIEDYFVDNEARIIEIKTHDELTSSTSRIDHLNLHKNETLPLFFSDSKKEFRVRDLILPKKVFNTLSSIERGIANKTNLELNYISYLPGDVLKIVVKTKLGVELYFDTEDSEQQISKLVTFLGTKQKDDLEKLQYIDLRFGDRIYAK